MGRKPKSTVDQKVEAVQMYLSGQASAAQIALGLGMNKTGESQIRKWVHRYRVQGTSGFVLRSRNQSYSAEFKQQVVDTYLLGGISFEDLALKHGVSNQEVVRQWIIKYNNRLDNKDYNPLPEVYMAPSRTTTFEERVEIAQYCLDHQKNYKDTAAKFNCSYSQVRNWTIKLEKEGEEGLRDRRGRKKAEEQLTETQKLKKQIEALERKNKYLEMENELLKKADEWERRAIARWQITDESSEEEN